MRYELGVFCFCFFSSFHFYLFLVLGLLRIEKNMGDGRGGGVVVITELQGDRKIKATILYYSLYTMWEM